MIKKNYADGPHTVVNGSLTPSLCNTNLSPSWLLFLYGAEKN